MKTEFDLMNIYLKTRLRPEKSRFSTCGLSFLQKIDYLVKKNFVFMKVTTSRLACTRYVEFSSRFQSWQFRDILKSKESEDCKLPVNGELRSCSWICIELHKRMPSLRPHLHHFQHTYSVHWFLPFYARWAKEFWEEEWRLTTH